MSAHHLFEPTHKDTFVQQFTQELLTQGESHGHQLEDLLDPVAFPELKTASMQLAAAKDPVSFVSASMRIRNCLEEAAHNLAIGVFDSMESATRSQPISGGFSHAVRA